VPLCNQCRRSGPIYVLDESATATWRLLDGDKSVAGLSPHLRANNDVTNKKPAGDVLEFSRSWSAHVSSVPPLRISLAATSLAGAQKLGNAILYRFQPDHASKTTVRRVPLPARLRLRTAAPRDAFTAITT